MIVLSLSVKEINTDEFGHCVLLSDTNIQAIITIDYGPRIVSVTTNSKTNLIYHEKDTQYNRCHGHKMRLTIDKPSNGLYCDNSPVMYSPLDDGVKFTQTITEPFPLEVSMDIIPNNETSSLMIVHSVLNKDKNPVKLAIYTETPLIHNGFLFVPQSNITENDTPSKILTLWNNSKWTDSRLYLGEQYITVAVNDSTSKLKIGSNNTAGWCGYMNGTHSFIKRYIHNRTALYPFCHCSTHAVATDKYLSIQTSSPFYRIESLEIARHVENWIFPDSEYTFNATDEISIDNFINSL